MPSQEKFDQYFGCALIVFMALVMLGLSAMFIIDAVYLDGVIKEYLRTWIDEAG